MLLRTTGQKVSLVGLPRPLGRSLVVITLLIAVCSGCKSPGTARKLARERWSKASARIKLGMAQQQYDQGRYEQATTTVRQSIQADPEFTLAHLLLGKLLLVQGDVDAAVAELKAVVQIEPALDEAWYWLGVSAQHYQDNEQAYAYYQKALSLKPIDVDYILAVAEVLVAQNKPEQAAAFLESKALVLPQEISLHVATADLMSRLARYERAIQLYRKAALMTSDNADIFESLAYCNMFSGNWALAADVFAELAKDSKDEHKNKIYLEAEALCSMNSDQYDRAVNCYHKLGRRQGDSAETWVKMGQAALGAGIPHRALRCAREALVLQPDYTDAVALLGSALYASGEFEAALQTFDRLTCDSPGGAFCWLMKARCYEKLGQQEEAQQAYDRARQIDPGSRLGNLLAGGNEQKS